MSSKTISTVDNLLSVKELKLISSEPEWFQSFRKNSWSVFQNLPFESDPNMLNFVHPKILKEIQYSFPLLPLADLKLNLKPNQKENQISFLVSPSHQEALISKNYESLLNKKISFLPLLLAIKSVKSLPDILNSFSHLPISDKLVAATLSTTNWGSYLHLTDNISLESPLEIQIANTTDTAKSYLLVIEIGSNVEATIDLTFLSEKTVYDHSVTLVTTGSNSQVNILVSDNGFIDRKTNRGFITKIGRDSSVNFSQVQVDGSYVRQRAEFYFTQEGGELVEVACLRAYKKQDYDFYSAVYHLTPKCRSNTFARGVNDNESSTVFKGKVDIGKDGSKVNTDLSLHGLLLSKKAKFHSIPAMEVINNNVIATHGASVSQIDPEQIFYFQTRGIAKTDAEHMIASGYFEPALTKIRSNYLQDKARNIISAAVNEQFKK